MHVQLTATEEGRLARLVGPQPLAYRGHVSAAHGHVGQGHGGGDQGDCEAGVEGIQTPQSPLSKFRCYIVA